LCRLVDFKSGTTEARANPRDQRNVAYPLKEIYVNNKITTCTLKETIFIITVNLVVVNSLKQTDLGNGRISGRSIYTKRKKGRHTKRALAADCTTCQMHGHLMKTELCQKVPCTFTDTGQRGGHGTVILLLTSKAFDTMVF